MDNGKRDMKKFIFVIALLIFLNACGGGDSNPTYRLVQILTESSNSSSTARQYFTYNNSGLLTGYTFDSGNDGVVNERVTYFHDSSNRLIKEENYRDNNESPDYRITYYYGTDGRVEFLEFDNLLYTEFTKTGYFFYDDNNQVERIEFRDQFNNLTITNKYEYDENGYISRMELASGVRTDSYVFDENGRIQRRLLVFDYDLDTTHIQTFFYEEGPCIIPEPHSLMKHHCQ